MKIILDQNVSPRVADVLRTLGHEVLRAGAGVPDEEILALAVEQQAVVVTCDEDFGELVHRRGLPHAGIVMLSLRVNRADNQARVLERGLRDGRVRAGVFVKLTDSDLA